jgi:hypothetical protein
LIENEDVARDVLLGKPLRRGGAASDTGSDGQWFGIDKKDDDSDGITGQPLNASELVEKIKNYHSSDR